MRGDSIMFSSKAMLLPNFFMLLQKSHFGGKGYASHLKTQAPQEALGNRHERALQHLHGRMALLRLLAGQVAVAEPPQHLSSLQQIPASEHIKR